MVTKMKIFKERLKISLINVGKLILYALAYMVVMAVVLLIAIYAYEAIIFFLWAVFALVILLLVIFYIYWQFIEPFKISKKEGEEDEA